MINCYVLLGEFRGYLLCVIEVCGTELAREIQVTDWSTAGEQVKAV